MSIHEPRQQQPACQIDHPSGVLSSRGEGRREAVLRVARDVLVKEGYDQFVLRRVAAAAEMKLGNLQYYFATRDDLLEAVIRAQFEPDLTALRVATDLPDDDLAIRACLQTLCSREQVLGAVARCAGVKASMFFHRGLHSSTPRCRTECRAARTGFGDTP
ncbi:TetR/AcrR family transcriptional regulator [Kribbella qitaiheensis]|uniref:TetR/AcrR family transcriptional regulator n=1 Tax=Kribbella qitaiheensis TaxID=1544730 RepID=A0A7G6X476_9ACTN|nr:TetR/AcrR family transcriptional regulator [Kribbella qitaiheensis]QNE21041.1 TetR/AcrR family transcriptional regulator [Kribbella qitaiheensis]